MTALRHMVAIFAADPQPKRAFAEALACGLCVVVIAYVALLVLP